MPPDPPEASTDATSPRPVRADVTTTDTAGGALVAVTLRNDTAVDLRVRVDNELDGPVLPPRREGVPAAGWDEGGFTGVVPANSRVGIGYACPCVGRVGDAHDGGDADDVGGADGDAAASTPAEPASNAASVSVELLGPAEADEPSAPDRVADAVRSLGRATPPADAVPSAETADDDSAVDGSVPDSDPAVDDSASDSDPAVDDSASDSDSAADDSASDSDSAADHRLPTRGGSADPDSSDVPVRVIAWLDEVDARIRRAERLTDATADEAAAVLEACGGVDDVATLPDELARDLASLRAFGARIEDLTARATATDPGPVVRSLAAAADGETPAPSGSEGKTAAGGNETIADARGGIDTDSGSGERR